MKGYSPYILSGFLVLIFSFVLSCSENNNEKKLSEEVKEVYDQVFNNHQAFSLANDSLQASVVHWKEEHDVFTDDYQPSDTLEYEHIKLYEEFKDLVQTHDSLLNQHSQFLQKIDNLQERIDNETEEVSNELEKVYVQIDEYVKRHTNLMERYKIIEEKHNDYLYGQRIDEH